MKKLLPLFISAALGSMSTSAFADSLAEIYDLAKQNDPQNSENVDHGFYFCLTKFHKHSALLTCQPC